MPKRLPVTISLQPDTAAQLRDLAERDHDGNVSAAVAELVRGSVTKACWKSPQKATRAKLT